ncbi:NHLP-related RiPP peptide [Stenotrophomonas rhizophila]
MTSIPKPLSPEDSVRLLELLGSDDDFRTLFQANPPAALAIVSEAAGKASVDCSSAGALASKEEFQAARSRLLSHLTSEGAFTLPHCFVSGDVDSSLSRKPRP